MVIAVNIYEPYVLTTDKAGAEAEVIAHTPAGIRVVGRRVTSGFVAVKKRADPERKGFTQFQLPSGETVSYNNKYIDVKIHGEQTCDTNEKAPRRKRKLKRK